ncbi:MAG: 3-deoxy-8-phosphooctulonate synthase [Aestuariivita sp.]|nr:3-deoxy-8-phosphooctulonate synthase [Aestuariivita sp.]
MKKVNIADLVVGNDLPLTVIAGPCQLESANHAQMIAGKLKETCTKLNAQFIFKASYDKANRTSITGIRGLGIDAGLKILDDLRQSLNVPVLTDVHSTEQCDIAAQVVDILQIPAFLCRQTDLLIGAAKTGAAINIKKGQFLAPWDMKHVVQKISSTGNNRILLTERGTCFGYNTLVVDPRALPQLAQTGYPVVIDATHSVQQPGGKGSSSDGQREFAPIIARAAISVGVAAVFIETHQDPDKAPSDGPNMIPLSQMHKLIMTLTEFDQLAKKYPVSI